MYQTSQITCTLMGHSPIGKYYFNWPNCFPDFPYHCSHCHEQGGGVLLKHVGTSSPSVADTKSISHPFNTRKKPKTTTNSSSLFFMIIHLRTICLHVPGSSPRCPLGHISGHAHLTFLLLTMYSTLLMFPFTTCPVCIRKLPEGSSYYYFDYSHNCFFCT